jgi:hypothetical protein
MNYGKVKRIDDFGFTCDFYLNVHYLCQENADSFWCHSHREQITSWLKNAPIITTAFDTTWILSHEGNKTTSSNETDSKDTIAVGSTLVEVQNEQSDQKVCAIKIVV